MSIILLLAAMSGFRQVHGEHSEVDMTGLLIGPKKMRLFLGGLSIYWLLISLYLVINSVGIETGLAIWLGLASITGALSLFISALSSQVSSVIAFVLVNIGLPLTVVWMALSLGWES